MKVLAVLIVVAFGTLASAETLPDFVNIKRNEVEARSESTIEGTIEQYIKTHDFSFKLPFIGSTVTFGGRNLDQEELDVKLNFGTEVGEARKKSKLKKIFVPIFVFILIKAMVLIPLALGILAIKTWNALQLSFVSFVVAIAMGVWQLCKKIAGDHPHPHIVAHSAWEDPHHFARSFDEEAQKMAYSSYVPKN